MGRHNFKKEVIAFLEKERQARIQDYKIRYENNPMTSLKEGTLVHRQLTEKLANKNAPKYAPDIFIITKRNGLGLTLKNFTNKDEDRIYNVHVKHTKLFVPRKSEYFGLLSESVKRLLGYPADKEIIQNALKTP